jgi:uncharacterized protein (TIGR03086 family)
MIEVLALFHRAVAFYDTLVQAIADDQWALPTPCAGWDVRTLLNHAVYEARWIPPCLAGQTIEEVGDRFHGDLLGDEPKAAWEDARAGASAAAVPGIESATVHLSRGPAPAREYLTEVTCDFTIHAWDLAQGIGADHRLDPDLVQFAWDYFTVHADEWRAYGVLSEAAPVPAEADLQTRLLALTGRRA